MDAYPAKTKLRDLTENEADAHRELQEAIQHKQEAERALDKAMMNYAKHAAALTIEQAKQGREVARA